jgi:hypothetical protein
MSTPARMIERVIPESALQRTPRPGDVFVTQRGATLFSVVRVRKIMSSGAVAVRLIGCRITPEDVPVGIAPLPWPVPRHANRAAMPPPLDPPPAGHRRDGTPIGPIVSRARQQTEQRKRIVALKHDETDHRLRVGLAVEADWKDPDDIDPRARASPRAKSAKVIHGIRATDMLAHLAEVGTVSRSQRIAGMRFRTEWELGEIGLGAGRNLGEQPVGFGPGLGPSATRLLHLEKWQATIAALKPANTKLLLATVVGGETLTHYAASNRLNRGIVTGRLLGALDFLRDYYEEVDEKTKVRERETA